jgi:hypothetical protein
MLKDARFNAFIADLEADDIAVAQGAHTINQEIREPLPLPTGDEGHPPYDQLKAAVEAYNADTATRFNDSLASSAIKAYVFLSQVELDKKANDQNFNIMFYEVRGAANPAALTAEEVGALVTAALDARSILYSWNEDGDSPIQVDWVNTAEDV